MLEWELASFEAFIPGVVRGGTDWAALNNGALENLKKQNKGNINAREEVFFFFAPPSTAATVIPAPTFGS